MTESTSLRPRGPKSKRDYRFIERPRLDINDLLAIENEMGSIGPVRVTSDQFTGAGSSVSEFRKTDFRSLESLRFDVTGTNYSSMRVDLGPAQAYITGTGGDHQIAGVRVQIEQLLVMRSRKVVNFCASGAKYALLFSFMFGTIVLIEGGKGKGTVLGRVGFGADVGFLIVSAIFYLVGRASHGEISLLSRGDSPGWWRRNRDALIVQVVAGAVLLAVGVIIGRLTK
jgi:hypothetical protein